MNYDIQQQFKYTEPVKCINDHCENRMRWELNEHESLFLDWQKLRVQEPSTDIPAGSMPRSVDIILRGDTVDSVKPGDRAIFTGMIIVVPDVVQLMKPGEVLQSQAKTFKLKRNDARAFDGVTGLKRLGVKDLNYKMVFMASTVH